jgi:hypothetical protein
MFYLQVPAANPIALAFIGARGETGTEFYLLFVVIDRYSIFSNKSFALLLQIVSFFEMRLFFGQNNQVSVLVVFFCTFSQSSSVVLILSFFWLKISLLVWYYLTPDSKLRTYLGLIRILFLTTKGRFLFSVS